MEFITVSETATKWGISVHRVQELCRHGRVVGAQRFGRDWMVPADAEKPSDHRYKTHLTAEQGEAEEQMPKITPFLELSELYSGASHGEQIKNKEAKLLFDAESACAAGEMKRAEELASELSVYSKNCCVLLGAMRVLGLCAVWKGDAQAWNNAVNKARLVECRDVSETAQKELVIAMLYQVVGDNSLLPKWLISGDFTPLPQDSHEAARVVYLGYLLGVACDVATKKRRIDGVGGVALLGLLPYVAEPMITQAVASGSIVAEIYFRLICATAYSYCGQIKKATAHVDVAVKSALKNNLCGILASYRDGLDRLIEDRMIYVDVRAVKREKERFREYFYGWAAVVSQVGERNVALNLTVREREVARLASFGLTTKEIAAHLNIAESTAKQAISNVLQKTGLSDRSGFLGVL